jgi:DNA-binding transcriptional regulator YiaG
MTTFNAHTLREQLAFYGKTQEDFARDLSVSVTTVSRWMNHKHKPNKLTTQAIIHQLKLYEEEKCHDSAA